MTQEHEPTYLQDVIAPKDTEKAPEGFGFDAEKYITEDAWKAGLNILRRDRDEANAGAFAQYAVSMYLLFPARRKELGLDQEIWQRVQNSLSKSAAKNDLEYLAHVAAAAKIIFSEHSQEVPINEETWQKLLSILRQYKETGYTYGFLPLAKTMVLLFPHRRKELLLDEDTWQGIADVLRADLAGGYWRAFVERAAKAKLLFPERSNELEKLGLNKKTWQNSLNELHEEQQDPGMALGVIFTHALAIKILATPKVTVGENGIHFENATPTFAKEPIPPMPEERKF